MDLVDGTCGHRVVLALVHQRACRLQLHNHKFWIFARKQYGPQPSACSSKLVESLVSTFFQFNLLTDRSLALFAIYF
jgi:hypothetical protein